MLQKLTINLIAILLLKKKSLGSLNFQCKREENTCKTWRLSHYYMTPPCQVWWQ